MTARRTLINAAALFAIVSLSGVANASDQGITGKKLLIKGNKLLVLSKDPTISAAGSNPVSGSDSTISFDNGGGTVSWGLSATLWSANGGGTLFKYKNSQAGSGPSPVKVAKVTGGLLKAISIVPPFLVPTGPATIDVVMSLDGGSNTYCMSFSGTGDGQKFLVKDAAAGSCAGPVPTPTSTPTPTVPPCASGGVLVGGSCWYFGPAGLSCDYTCTNIGKSCDPATINYAGTGGTSANCAAVLTALGVTDPYSGDFSPCSTGAGCVDAPFYEFAARCVDVPTNCADGFTGSRACACSTSSPAPTPTPTVPPCPSGGVAVGGSCWYLGPAGLSCDYTCTNIGKSCDPATINYTGTGGTSANCAAVLTALGVTDPYIGDVSPCNTGVGCVQAAPAGVQSERCVDVPTDCAAINFVYRVCACN